MGSNCPENENCAFPKPQEIVNVRHRVYGFTQQHFIRHYQLRAIANWMRFYDHDFLFQPKQYRSLMT